MIRKLRSVNWTLVTAWIITRGYLVGAAYLSFFHIIDVAEGLDAGAEAWTWPLMIDGLAILGRLLMSKRLAVATRRFGVSLFAGAGLVSLTCNVMAGDTTGEKLTGLGVVVGFLVAEVAASLLAGAPAAAPAKSPNRVAGALKGVETKREKAAEAARLAAEEAARIAALTPAQRGAETRRQRRLNPAPSFA